MTNENSKVREVEIHDEQEGQRIDNFLLRELKGVPRSRIYRIVRKGEVRVNKKRIKPEYRLLLGDIVRIPPVRIAAPSSPARPSEKVQIYFEKDLYFLQNQGTLYWYLIHQSA